MSLENYKLTEGRFTEMLDAIEWHLTLYENKKQGRVETTRAIAIVVTRLALAPQIWVEEITEEVKSE